MKRQHLTKMSDLIETLTIVSNNAKNKGHRSGFRCNQLAKEIADQFAIFIPSLLNTIGKKEYKKNRTKNRMGLSKGEFEIYQVVKSKPYNKLVDIFEDTSHDKTFNTTRQYVFLLKKKGFVQSINVHGKKYKYYNANTIEDDKKLTI